MSRAFVKEDGPDAPALPDLPVSAHPNWVTPQGLASLRARLAARTADLAHLRSRPDRLDRLPEAAAERDIRYLDARLASATVVEPSAAPGEVTFGAAVTVQDDAGRRRTFRIVGEDEADPPAGLITAQSPLARALMGLRLGDEAEWRGGDLRIVSVSP